MTEAAALARRQGVRLHTHLAETDDEGRPVAYNRVAGVVVTAYTDAAEGTLTLEGVGGRFVEVVLHPRVTISATSDAATAAALHADAHHACFIANSVNFPVRCEPHITVAAA